MPMNPEIIRTHSFVETAAAFVANAANQAIEEHGFFRIALSGGNTPRTIYQALALKDCRWPKWIVTFGDERCVPPEDPQSNFRMASEAFLLLTSPGEVFRIQGEIDPEEALERTNKKFIKRFQYLESESAKDGKKMGEMTLAEMDIYWNKAKEL